MSLEGPQGGDMQAVGMSFDRSILEDIEANLRTLEIDEIKRRLQPLMVGYGLVTPIFDPGAFLYRARRVSNSFNKGAGITLKDLIYPPKPAVGLGRLNRPEQPVFYSSMHKESVFFRSPGPEARRRTRSLVLENFRENDRQQYRLHRIRLSPTWSKTGSASVGETSGSQFQ